MLSPAEHTTHTSQLEGFEDPFDTLRANGTGKLERFPKPDSSVLQPIGAEERTLFRPMRFPQNDAPSEKITVRGAPIEKKPTDVIAPVTGSVAPVPEEIEP